MQKSKVKILFAMVALFLAGVSLAGCFKNKYYNLAVAKLAENRQNMYYGETENLEVSLMSGTREKEYIINGYCTEPVEFGVLTFKLLKNVDFAGEPLYTITIGTTRYDGVLEKNPFDGTYVADLQKIISDVENVTAKLLMGEFVEEIVLSSVTSNWKVNHKEALKIACSKLSTELQNFVQNSEFVGEVYVKIINDQEVEGKVYYWYVNFVNRDGKNVAIIIEPNSKEILTKKNY